VLSPFDLTPGHALAPVTFVITAEEARAYIQAVDDTSVLYHQAAAPLPPLLLAARGLQLLMAQVEIPAGTVHGGQECEFLQPTYADRELRLTVSAHARRYPARAALRDPGDAYLRWRCSGLSCAGLADRSAQ